MLTQYAVDGSPGSAIVFRQLARALAALAKESTIQVARRHFNAPVDKIEGTVKSVNSYGVKLAEYPGWIFRFSSVGTSMADRGEIT